jgi:hypothetical protein
MADKEHGKDQSKTSWKSILFAHKDVDVFRDTPIRYLGEWQVINVH